MNDNQTERFLNIFNGIREAYVLKKHNYTITQEIPQVFKVKIEAPGLAFVLVYGFTIIAIAIGLK